MAAEFGRVDAAQLLLDRGAGVDARATVDEAGVGGQTALFHAASQWGGGGLPMVRLLVERGADLSIRVRLPGHYERPDKFVLAALGYARQFLDEPPHAGENATVAFLRRAVPSNSYGEDRIASRRLVAAMMSRLRRRTISATRSRPPAAASSTIVFSS